MGLKVIVIGGGIAGFATAIGFAKQGHQVTVLERRGDANEDSGSAIQIQPNAAKILKEWGMLDDLAKIAHDNESATITDGLTGELVVTMEYTSRGGQWLGLRSDVRTVFYETALKHGTKVLFNVQVSKVDEIDDHPTVILEDERHIQGDLVIGADGTRSKIRESIFPDYKPEVLSECCFQVRVPFEKMNVDPETAALAADKKAQLFSAPYRSTFSSVILKPQVFDLQVIDHDYTLEQDPHPNIWTEQFHDKVWLQSRFDDHIPAFTKVLEMGGDTAYKWRFILVRNLPSWTSSSGRILLVGDACHAMPPYSGQGSGMAIEDAAVLSQLFAKAEPNHDLGQLSRLYEKIRRPRCELVQTLARSNGRSLAIADPQIQQRRKQILQHMNRAIQESTNADVVPDGKANFSTPSFNKWLDNYDVAKEVHEALKASGLDMPQAKL